jgi:hypothetical protein
VKGPADTFKVGVLRGTERFFVEPDGTLEAGDQLGFFYSASRAGFLTVIDRDETGRLTLLTDALAIAPGEAVSLPDGAELEPGKGCDWLVAVFSDRPLDRARVEAAVRAAPQVSERCGYARPVLVEARSIETLRVGRAGR